jgi:hypothetical protein
MGEKDRTYHKGSKAKKAAKTAAATPIIAALWLAMLALSEAFIYIIGWVLLIFFALVLIGVMALIMGSYELMESIGIPGTFTCIIQLVVFWSIIFIPSFLIVRKVVRIYRKKQEDNEYERILRILTERDKKRKEPEDIKDKYGDWEDQDGQANVKMMNPMRGGRSQHYEGRIEDPEDYYKKRWKE